MNSISVLSADSLSPRKVQTFYSCCGHGSNSELRRDIRKKTNKCCINGPSVACRSTILQQQFNRVGRVEHGSVALPGVIRSGSIGTESLSMGTMPSAQQQITMGQMHRGHMPPLVRTAKLPTLSFKGACCSHRSPLRGQMYLHFPLSHTFPPSPVPYLPGEQSVWNEPVYLSVHSEFSPAGSDGNHQHQYASCAEGPDRSWGGGQPATAGTRHGTARCTVHIQPFKSVTDNSVYRPAVRLKGHFLQSSDVRRGLPVFLGIKGLDPEQDGRVQAWDPLPGWRHHCRNGFCRQPHSRSVAPTGLGRLSSVSLPPKRWFTAVH